VTSANIPGSQSPTNYFTFFGLYARASSTTKHLPCNDVNTYLQYNTSKENGQKSRWPAALNTNFTTDSRESLMGIYHETHGSSICLRGSASHAESFLFVLSTQLPVQRRWRCSSGGSQPSAVGGLTRDGLTAGGVALAATSTSDATDCDAPERATAAYRSSTVGWGGMASSCARDSLTRRSWRRTARRAAAELFVYSCSSSDTDMLARYRRYDLRPWRSGTTKRTTYGIWEAARWRQAPCSSWNRWPKYTAMQYHCWRNWVPRGLLLA